MTDHDQLLLVVRDHLAPFKDTLWTQVFLHPCPETDSSFLHVAAALGHIGVIPTLLDACGDDIADARGRSAAAVAAENFQLEAFALLVPEMSRCCDDYKWQLKDHANRHSLAECLLHVCAACGNIDAIALLVDRQKRFTENDRLVTRGLSEAFLLACYEGHISAALYLVTLGVSPDGYGKISQWSHNIRVRVTRTPIKGRSWNILLPYRGSFISLALEVGDLALMENLLASGASFNNREDHCDVSDVVEHFVRHRDLRNAE